MKTKTTLTRAGFIVAVMLTAFWSTVTAQPTVDLFGQRVMTPVEIFDQGSGTVLDSDITEVKVSVRNKAGFDFLPQDDYGVVFAIDGTIMDTLTSAEWGGVRDLAAGTGRSFTFENLPLTEPGVYNLSWYPVPTSTSPLSYIEDDPSDDTASVSMRVLKWIAPVANSYSEDLDACPDEYFTDATLYTSNWQCGAFPFGAKAGSGNGWYRSTASFTKGSMLSLGEMSYVQFPVFDFSGFDFDPVINMDIYYNTTVGYGITFQYSTNGTDWYPVGAYNTQDVYASNWFNTELMNFIGDPGWSGNSNGWVNVSHTLTNMAGEDVVYLRMAFVGEQGVVKSNNEVGFDNIAIEESLGVEILSTANPVDSSNMSLFSIMRGQSTTLTANIHGDPGSRIVYWYSSTADEVFFFQWLKDQMKDKPLSQYEPWTTVIWSCVFEGTGPTLTVNPDSSTFYYAVLDDATSPTHTPPCDGGGIAWPGQEWNKSKAPVFVTGAAAVAVVDTLTVEAEFDGHFVCDTAVTPIYAFPDGGLAPYTYSWSPTATLSSGATSEVAYSVANNTTTYTVTVTDDLGNTATDDVTVSVVSGYAFVDIVPNNAILCDGDSVQLTAYGGSTWSWYTVPPGAATFSDSNGVNTYVIPTGTHTSFDVWVDITSSCGNASTSMDLDVLTPPADPTFAYSTTNFGVCSDDNVVDLIASVGPNPAGGTFSGTSVVNGLFDPQAVTPGSSYEITYTIQGVNGCYAESTFDIFVENNPENYMDISGADTVCVGDIETYTRSSVMSPAVVDSVHWTVVVGGDTLSTTSSTATVEWTTAGLGIVNAVVYTELCTAYLTDTVIINPLPVISIESFYGATTDGDTLIYCEDEIDSLYVDITPGGGLGYGGYSAFWNVEALNIATAGGTFSGFGLYETGAVNLATDPDNAAIQYWMVDVTVYDSSTMCSSTDTVYLKVFNTPEGDFFAPGFDTLKYCIDGSVPMDDLSGYGADSFNIYDEYGYYYTTAGQIFPAVQWDTIYTAPDTVTFYAEFFLNGCMGMDSAVLVLWELPEVYNLDHDGDLTFCYNTTGPELYLDNSDITDEYDLYRDGAVVATVNGDGDSITFGNWNLPGEYWVVATDTNTGCVNYMADTLTLVSDTITINLASEFDTVCPTFTSRMTVEFDSLALVYGSASTYVYDWDPTGSKFTPDGFGTGIATPGSDSTLYTVTVYAPGDSACTATDSFLLEVLDAPMPAIGSGISANVTDTNICLGSSVDLLLAWVPGSGSVDTIIWTPSTGVTTSGTTQPVTVTFSNTVSTTYKVQVIDEFGCIGYDSVNVTVNVAPLVQINNGVPASICPGYDTTLTAVVTFGSGSYSYTWSTGALTSSITVNPTADSTYYVTVYDAGLNCYGYDSIVVDVNDAPTITDMGEPYFTCQWGEINFAPTYTGSPASFTWTDMGGPAALPSIASTANPTIAMNGIAPGLYQVGLEIEDVNGCVVEDSAYINVTVGPSISAGADQYICEGTTVTLTGSGGNGTTSYSWYSDTNYAPANLIANQVSIDVTPDTTTTYYLRVNNDSCGVATSQVTVYVHPETDVFFDGLATDFCEVDDPITLTNVSPVGGTFSGEGVDPVTGVFDPGAVTTLDAPITIVYEWADSSASPLYPVCIYSHSMTTTVWSTPVVTIDPVAAVCEDAAAFPVTDFNGAPAAPAGTYTVDGVVVAGNVDPAALGAGVYDVWYFYADVNGCMDSAMTTFEVLAVPQKYTLVAASPTNGGHYCDGDSADITLSNSEVDVTYDLYLKTSLVATATFQNTVAGTGSAISFGEFASDGFYYVLATNDTSGCTSAASDTIELIQEDLPQQFNLIVENGGHYCADGACETAVCNGVQIGMFSTNREDKYFLYEVGNSTPLAEMNGTVPSGQPKWFPGTYTAGQYYVEAIDTTTPAMCPQLMLDTVTVTEDPKPAMVTLSKDNVCQCPGEFTTISISSAEATVDYVLYFGGVAIDTINGTTSFDPVNVVGTYEVVAYKRSSGSNPWNNAIFGVPATWSTVCVDTMGTIDVCEYTLVNVDALDFYDQDVSTPANMTIDGGEIGWLKVDVSGDYPLGAFQWQMREHPDSAWMNVVDGGYYSGATTDSLTIDSVIYPDMTDHAFRFIVTGYCNADTSDIVEIDLRPNITVYAGEPVWASKSLDSTYCADEILVPIYAENFDSVGAVSLVLIYDETVMTWIPDTALNIHPALSVAFPQIGPGLGAGRVAVAVQTLNPINIGNDVLFYLPFKMGRHGGYSDLTWDFTVAGRNQLADVDAELFKAKFVNGSVTGLALPYPNVNLSSVEICEGDELFLTAAPYSTSGGNPVSGYWTVPDITRGAGGYIFTNDTSFIMTNDDEGDYTYFATDGNGCTFDTSVFVQVNPLPTVFDVTPASDSACVGGAVEIGLTGSQEGVKYYLMYNSSIYQPAGYPAYVINGTGGPVTFGPVAAPANMGLGTFAFTVMAVDTTYTTNCDIMMNGTAMITITPRPFSFDLRVIDDGSAVISGDYCAGGPGLDVVLGGSQLGVTYELWYAPYCCSCPDSLVTEVQGTGSSLSFGHQTAAGYYHVRAYFNGTLCDEYMNNCVFIEINDLPTASIAGDAEICVGESTDLTISLTGLPPYEVTINELVGLTNTSTTYTGIMTNTWVLPVAPTATATYTINNVVDANGCENTGTGTATVIVNPLPVADVLSDKAYYCVGDDLDIWALPATGMTYQWSGPDGYMGSAQRDTILNVTTANAGWYYVTVTDNVTGCVNYDSLEIVIHTLPIAIALGDEVCEGETIYIDGTNSYGTDGSIVDYAWTGPNGFTSGAADTSFGPATLAMAGQYTLMVTDEFGCTADAQATVTVHALPNANAGMDVDICLNECVTLIATGGDDYYWSNGMANDSNEVCPTDTTMYIVTVTENHGQVSCSNVDTVYVNVLPLPEPYELTQDGIYCFGCFGIPVELVHSDLGINYVLYHQPLAGGPFVAVDTLAGVDGALFFGEIEVPGTYKVLGVNQVTGCEQWMVNEIIIGLRPAPTADFGGDIDVCADECETVTVTLTGLTPFTIHYAGGNVVVYDDADLSYVGLVNGVETWTYDTVICGATANAYIGIDLVEDSVCFRTGDTAMINVLPLPAQYDVTGGGYYCNIGVPVGLAGSQIGVSYVLYLNGSAIDTVAGTGTTLSFGPQTQLGMYTVVGVNDVTGCTNDMNGYAEITGGQLPTVYDVYGDAYFCTGDSAHIYMMYSEVGVTYELLLNGISTGVTVAGTGSSIDFGYVSTVGSYTVQGIDDVTSCISLMNGEIDVVEKPLPTANVSGSTTICSGDNAMITVTLTGTPPFNFYLNGVSYTTNNYTWSQNFSPMSTKVYKVSMVTDEYCENVGGDSATVTVSKPTAYTITGGGVYCEGGLGKVIGLNGSEVGVTYELYIGGVATGQFQAGTGSPISFGYQTAAGVYSIVGTYDGNGCTGNMTGTVSITINPLPEVMNVTGGDSCCIGCEIIYIGLDSTEPNSNIRYELWRNGSLYTNPAFAPKYGTGAAIEWGYMTQAGTYTIRAVNEITGCGTFMNGSAVAYFWPEPAGTISGNDTICEGEASQFTVTFTAGTPPFSVLVYEDGDTLQYFTNIPGPSFTYPLTGLTPGVHTYELVEIADDTCFAQATGTATIVVNALPTISLYMPEGYCLDATPDTLVQGYPMGGTYKINGSPATVFDPAALGVGVHTVEYTYTDVNGCTNSEVVDVEVYALPICDVTGGTYCIDAAAFTLSSGTPVGGTYYIDGMVATSFDPAAYGVGGYEVMYSFTDTNGCVCSSVDSIFVVDKPVVDMDPVADQCWNGAPATLTGSPAGGVFSGVGVTGNTFDPSAVPAPGTYMITYEIMVGVCAAVDTEYVYVNDLPGDMPLEGDTIVCEFTNQAVGLGATEAGIEYQLYRNNNIINGQLITGTGSAMTFGTQSQEGIYTVYAFDPVTGCGRFMTDSVAIEWIPLPTVTTFGNGTHCTGDSTAVEFVFTGTPPFTLEYTINGADYVVSGILDSNYLLTFPSLMGNQNITNVRIIDLTCYNDGNDVNITVLPPTADVSMTGGGDYCEGEAGVVVGLDSTVVGVFYALYKDGVATGDVISGTGNAEDFAGLFTAGTYTAVATGSGSCETDVLGSAVVVENPLPVVVATAMYDTICVGSSTDLMASGADTYEWSTTETTSSITVSPTATTTYTVTGTTAAGCSAEATVTVVVNPAPVVAVTPASASICVGTDTDLTASGAVSYEWSTGDMTAMITVNPTSTTTYTVTGTDINGCTAEASVTVDVFTNPTVDITPSAPEICLGDDVVITATGADTYEWSTTETTAGITVSPTTTTTYTVTGTVAGGCTAEASVTVTVNDPPVLSITSDLTICEGGSAMLTVSGADTYEWSTTETTASITVSPMTTTTYTVTGTSVDGCTAVADVTVTVATPQTVDAGADQLITSGASATLTATVTGGSGNFAYFWTPGGQTTPSIVVSPTDTTTYFVEVTDNVSGCVVSDDVTVNVISVVGDIAGVVTYKNAAGTPMNNTPVYLMNGASMVTSTTTDAAGAYSFTNVYAGSYTVVAMPTKAWGGANSNDALLILKHTVGISSLSGLNLAAADVTGEGDVNATDALQVAQRFVTLITSFGAGDWVSDATPVTISMAGLVSGVDVEVLCTGDVNGSFTPAAKASVEIINSGVKEVSSFETVEVPVSVSKDMTVGAISLVLDYPEDAVEVEGVLLGQESSSLLYTDYNGVLRISWYNMKSFQVNAGEALVTLQLRVKDLNYVMSDAIEITTNTESQIGNANAEVIENVNLSVPKLTVKLDKYAISNYPNPFDETTQFEYTLPEDGKVSLRVYNMLGEQVNVLLDNKVQEAGTYKVEWRAINLTPGTYTYQFEVNGATQQFNKTGMMVLTK